MGRAVTEAVIEIGLILCYLIHCIFVRSLSIWTLKELEDSAFHRQERSRCHIFTFVVSEIYSGFELKTGYHVCYDTKTM